MSSDELSKIGAFVFPDFLTREEEKQLASVMDSDDGSKWVNSQSGRRKQDFGPKANFKKKKAKLGSFSGMPSCMFPLYERIKGLHPILKNYAPVECLFLEYEPTKGAHIDPHFDANWL